MKLATELLESCPFMCVVCLSIHWPHSLGYNFVADGDDIVEGADGKGAKDVTPC